MSLSYAYMSPTFASAFLFSVLAFAFICGNLKWMIAIPCSVISLALSMGCYQAYLGVTCVLTLFYCMTYLTKENKLKDVGSVIVRLGSSVILGGGLYKICVSVVNWYYKVSLADYKGVGDVSIGAIIKALPKSIVQTYTDFYKFFITDEIVRRNFGGKYAICITAFLCVILVINLCMVMHINYKYVIMIIIACLLIPLFCNVTLIIAYGSGGSFLLMTGAMVLVWSLMVCLLYPYRSKLKIYPAFIFMLVVLLWINICSTTNDQVALRDGRKATETITDQILNKLTSDGYLKEDTVVAIAGRPSDSPLFRKTQAYGMANGYACFGEFWVENVVNNRHSWYYGMLQHYLGLNITWCDDEEFDNVRAAGYLDDMPNFPEEGSIKEIDGVTWVKVSDYYQ